MSDWRIPRDRFEFGKMNAVAIRPFWRHRLMVFSDTERRAASSFMVYIFSSCSPASSARELLSFVMKILRSWASM